MTERQIPEAEIVECAGCGRKADSSDAITPGNDTWFTLYAPWVLESRLGDSSFNCCSIGCLERAIDRLREPYAQVEEYLLGDPRHLLKEASHR